MKKVAILTVTTLAVLVFTEFPCHAEQNVIYGCYSKETGILRIVGGPGDCLSSIESPISWNQTGPQGPAGPAGPSGVLDISKIYYKQCTNIDTCACDHPEDILIAGGADCPNWPWEPGDVAHDPVLAYSLPVHNPTSGAWSWVANCRLLVTRNLARPDAPFYITAGVHPTLPSTIRLICARP
jgi:hypothetical protein